jgi:two-component system chemotaxis response regulator CheY
MTKTVVIVDDSKFIIDQLSHFMEQKLGFQVLGSGYDGNDAVALYRKHKPDLLVLDVCMPIKDGKAATKEILEEFKDAKILIVSAVRGNSILECLKIGASGFIEKPLKLSDPEYVTDFEITIKEIFLEKKSPA